MMRLMITAITMSWSLVTALGAYAADQAADEATIRKAVESYVAAFNQQDAKALAAIWSPEAVYTNPLSGEQVVGRDGRSRSSLPASLPKQKGRSWRRRRIPSSSSHRAWPWNMARPSLFLPIKSRRIPSTRPSTSSATDNGCWTE